MRRTVYLFFFFNDTATTEIYTLSLHDALPILSIARSVTWFHWLPTFESTPSTQTFSSGVKVTPWKSLSQPLKSLRIARAVSAWIVPWLVVSRTVTLGGGGYTRPRLRPA